MTVFVKLHKRDAFLQEFLAVNVRKPLGPCRDFRLKKISSLSLSTISPTLLFVVQPVYYNNTKEKTKHESGALWRLVGVAVREASLLLLPLALPKLVIGDHIVKRKRSMKFIGVALENILLVKVERKNLNEFKIHIDLDEKIEDFEISKYSLAKQEAHKQNVCPSLIREAIVFKEMSELLYSKNIELVQTTSYFDFNELFDMKPLKTERRYTRKSKEQLVADEVSQICIHKTKRAASEMLLKTVTVNERPSLPFFRSLVNIHEMPIYDRKSSLSEFGNQSSINAVVDNNRNAESNVLEKSASSPHLSTLKCTKSRALSEVCVQSKNVDVSASLPLINSLLTFNANNMIYNQDVHKKKCNKSSHRAFIQNLSSNVSKIECNDLIENC
ncbi:uncharacterized protein LOC136076023 [Hydra vulgaris]|uniref:Uncharacterized protein LOC136076023 n=1 Tax=Hydra vulgaris TaxID=6087 RepID=A0ABM4B9I9_HYDVU